MEDKLVKLRKGVTLVRPEERKAIAEMYSEKLSQWRKRKRMFKDVWDAITENLPKDLKEFKVIFICFHVLPAICNLVCRNWVL
jgi:26S proteasome regulatory subunit (ATPase 3-interacting protein)